jgi:hypothetical protein
MRYGSWGPLKERETRGFDERAYRRQALAAWDAKWHELSVQARYYFLNVVKGPAKSQNVGSTPPSVVIDRFPLHIMEELTSAGFVAVLPARSQASTERVIGCDPVYDFAARIRSLPRYHLLAADQPSELVKYANHAFFPYPLTEVLSSVLRKAEIDDHARLEDLLERYVAHHRWPGWVARALKDPLAERILDVFRQAAGPIPMAELPGRVGGSNPDQVRSVVDKLIAHLALVEDLQPGTWELMVGFLPSVREELIRASQPRRRPPLVICQRPAEIGPEAGALVNDVRALLLEVASDPPRLRQDHALFQKESERFQPLLETLPAWLLQALKWSDEGRLTQALAWARALQLVKEVPEGKGIRLHLTAKGHRWLTSGLGEQYAGIYDLLRTFPTLNDLYSLEQRAFFSGPALFGDVGPGDMRFLGEPVAARTVEKGKRPARYWEAKPEDLQALRASLDQALAVLELGVFYRLDSVIAHLVFAEHNPLNLGRAPAEVAVYWHERSVPPLEEQREEAGRLLIEGFVRRRLIPLGGLRAAIDGEGRLCIARQSRYDAYFGREVAQPGPAPTAELAARVVVQPDFSVMVIGPNPAPAAELAPFCERTTRGGGLGAMVLKITRDSVVKAVSHGMKPAEITARLQRHASNAVPANVLRQVQDWSNWVRQVTASTLTVLRCPDRDTADRVMGAMKRQAERVNDTLVALDRKKLTAAERQKLLGHGILVQAEPGAQERPAKARKRRW